MRVSIVTVCLNAVNEIERTILSVLSQTYTDIEYIVIDGGSTDGTKDIIHKYQHCIAHFISEPDKGTYDAMNKGVDLATGEWINFMNAGDILASETVVTEMFSNVGLNCDVLFGDTILIKGEKHIVSKGKILMSDFPRLVHQSVFVKTTLMKKYHFNLKYKISADFDFLYKLYKENYVFFCKSIVVSHYLMTGQSSSHRTILYREHCSIRGEKTLWYKFMKYKIEDLLPQVFINWLSSII